MKRFIAILVTLAFLLAPIKTFARPVVSMYPMTAVVVELDEERDEVICIDFNGNEWAFSEIEDWEVGNIVSMIMDDMGTEMIFDDEILSVRYGGWLIGDWGWTGSESIISF